MATNLNRKSNGFNTNTSTVYCTDVAKIYSVLEQCLRTELKEPAAVLPKNASKRTEKHEAPFVNKKRVEPVCAARRNVSEHGIGDMNLPNTISAMTKASREAMLGRPYKSAFALDNKKCKVMLSDCSQKSSTESTYANRVLAELKKLNNIDHSNKKAKLLMDNKVNNLVVNRLSSDKIENKIKPARKACCCNKSILKQPSTGAKALEIAQLREKFEVEVWNQKVLSTRKVLETLLEGLQTNKSFTEKQIDAEKNINRKPKPRPARVTGKPAEAKAQNKNRSLNLKKPDEDFLLIAENKIRLYENAVERCNNAKQLSKDMTNKTYKLKKKFATTSLTVAHKAEEKPMQHKSEAIGPLQGQREVSEGQQNEPKAIENQTMHPPSHEQKIECSANAADNELKVEPKTSYVINALPALQHGSHAAESQSLPQLQLDGHAIESKYSNIFKDLPSGTNLPAPEQLMPAETMPTNVIALPAVDSCVVQSSILNRLEHIENIVATTHASHCDILNIREDNFYLRQQVEVLRHKLEISNVLLRKIYFRNMKNSLRNHKWDKTKNPSPQTLQWHSDDIVSESSSTVTLSAETPSLSMEYYNTTDSEIKAEPRCTNSCQTVAKTSSNDQTDIEDPLKEVKRSHSEPHNARAAAHIYFGTNPSNDCYRCRCADDLSLAMIQTGATLQKLGKAVRQQTMLLQASFTHAART